MARPYPCEAEIVALVGGPYHHIGTAHQDAETSHLAH